VHYFADIERCLHDKDVMVRKTTHIGRFHNHAVQFLNAALDGLEGYKKEHELLRCISTKPVNPLPFLHQRTVSPPSTLFCFLPVRLLNKSSTLAPALMALVAMVAKLHSDISFGAN
jgi:hypothetical protein